MIHFRGGEEQEEEEKEGEEKEKNTHSMSSWLFTFLLRSPLRRDNDS